MKAAVTSIQLKSSTSVAELGGSSREAQTAFYRGLTRKSKITLKLIVIILKRRILMETADGQTKHNTNKMDVRLVKLEVYRRFMPLPS